MEYEEIVRIGLSFPDVEESLSYGTPCLKRKKGLMIRLKEDGETSVVKLDWGNRNRLLLESPDPSL